MLVTVEPYNILPWRRKSLKAIFRLLKALSVEDLFPYEELKLFIHNLSHACLAYAGYLKGYTYIWEALRDPDVRGVVDKVVIESREALIKKHRFAITEIDGYITDLINRFGNKLLNDTVFRVGQTPRKIGHNDRIARDKMRLSGHIT